MVGFPLCARGQFLPVFICQIRSRIESSLDIVVLGSVDRRQLICGTADRYCERWLKGHGGIKEHGEWNKANDETTTMAAAGSGEAKQLIATAKGHGGPLVVSLAANWFPLVLSSHRSPPSPSPARRCSAFQLQMAIASADADIRGFRIR